MMQDLLNSIYNRIAQLGQAIQSLKTTLDELNQNIEQKISNLNDRMLEFSKEINTTQTIHIDALKEIGFEVTSEIEKIRQGVALDSFQNMISSLENFEKLASEVLNQDTVNLLLSEAIESVKKLKENLREEEVSG
jgi:DNA anti-recombination protein RmuC